MSRSVPSPHPPPPPPPPIQASAVSRSVPSPHPPPPASPIQASAMSRSGSLALCCKVRTDEVVSDSLGLDAPKPEQPPSRPLRCAGKRALGFDSSNSPQDVVNALHMEAHLADAPALSHLKIQGGGLGGIHILAIDKNLILLESMLSAAPRTSIYIIYDAVARSIYMIPSHPWSQPRKPLSKDWRKRPTALVSRILIARPSSDSSSYALVSMAEVVNHSKKPNAFQSPDFLYLWRSSSLKWELIPAKFAPKFKGDNVAHSYTAVLAFSFAHWACWANLMRGIMYCSYDDLFSAPRRRGSHLKFHFIELPPLKYPPQLPSHGICAMEYNANMFRTMGCVGDASVQFVTIDGFMELLGFTHCTVTLWSLSQDMSEWTKSFPLSLGSIVQQEPFKTGGLSTDMVPMYPRLSNEDGVIYLMLGHYEPCCLKHKDPKDKCKEYVAAAGEALYLLRLDMRRGLLLDYVSLPDQFGMDLAFCDLGLSPSNMIKSEVCHGDDGRP